MNEFWIFINDTENRYMISNLGRVMTMERHYNTGHYMKKINQHIMKPSKNNKGYYGVVLTTKSGRNNKKENREKSL